MKLNWLSAGCASIAECGEYTVQCYLWCNVENEKKWVFDVYRTTTAALVKASPSRHDTREAAEAACEAWLDQFDKPVWHDATDWLSWAEWRGKRMTVNRHCGNHALFQWAASRTSGWDGGGRFVSMQDAKSAAEKYVREQTK